MPAMTTLFDIAVETARQLPPEKQDVIARLVLQMAGEDQSVYRLSEEELESLKPSLKQADNRNFASDAEVRTVWARHGL